MVNNNSNGSSSLSPEFTEEWKLTTSVSSALSIAERIELVYKDWLPYIAAWIFIYAVAALPGNLLLMTAFFKDPTLRTPYNTLICSQCFADFWCALAAFLFIFMNYTKAGLRVAMTNRGACLIVLGSLMLTFLTSLVSLFILSIERFIAVMFPYRYYSLFTDRTARIVIAVKWSMITCVMMLPVLGWNIWKPGNDCLTMTVYARVFFTFLYMLPSLIMLLVMTVLHSVIFWIAFKKTKVAPYVGPAIGTIQASGSATNDAENGSSSATQDHNQIINQIHGAGYKVTKVFLTTVGIFYVSWMPYIILTVLLFLKPEAKLSFTVHLCHEISKVNLGLNGIFNPYIYAKGNFKWNKVLERMIRQQT